MSSLRTKAFFWLSALPPLLLICAASWTMNYSQGLVRSGHATYFVIFHPHWFRSVLVSAALFVCGLISLGVDRRSEGERTN